MPVTMMKPGGAPASDTACTGALSSVAGPPASPSMASSCSNVAGYSAAASLIDSSLVVPPSCDGAPVLA